MKMKFDYIWPVSYSTWQKQIQLSIPARSSSNSLSTSTLYIILLFSTYSEHDMDTLVLW